MRARKPNGGGKCRRVSVRLQEIITGGGGSGGFDSFDPFLEVSGGNNKNAVHEPTKDWPKVTFRELLCGRNGNEEATGNGRISGLLDLMMNNMYEWWRTGGGQTMYGFLVGGSQEKDAENSNEGGSRKREGRSRHQGSEPFSFRKLLCGPDEPEGEKKRSGAYAVGNNELLKKEMAGDGEIEWTLFTVRTSNRGRGKRTIVVASDDGCTRTPSETRSRRQQTGIVAERLTSQRQKATDKFRKSF